MLVCRFDTVARIARLVQRDEEFLRVAIEAALPGLVGRDLDERVVTAFLSHAQLQAAEITSKRSRACGMARSLHCDSRKEFVCNAQDFYRGELRSKKMPH